MRMDRELAGTIAGFVATAPMTVAMMALHKALPPEDRRRPYRLTAVGASNLAQQLRDLSAFAQRGLSQLGKTEP